MGRAGGLGERPLSVTRGHLVTRSSGAGQEGRPGAAAAQHPEGLGTLRAHGVQPADRPLLTPVPFSCSLRGTCRRFL